MVTGHVSLDAWVIALVDVGVGALTAVVLRVVFRLLVRRAERTRWVGEVISGSLYTVVPWLVAVGGVWAAALSLPLERAWRADIDHFLLALAVLATTVGAARVAGGAVRAGALAHSGVSGSATIFVNITRAVVLAIGLMILLDSLGVSITPLLTALGVGGLAVALALQDTLTNLFAGVHILASRKVQPGDFIQLEGGQQGYVVDINWRNTTIRELPNNLVIVPNATLAGSTMVNYERPVQEMSVPVGVGVAYDSDLEHVERVTIEVGRDVMRTVQGGVPDHEPTVRFQAFAESSINFSVILRTAEAAGQYLIVHEFIKRLHRRYQAEGIEIPFPVRTIVRAPAPPAKPGAPPAPRVPAEAKRPALTD